MDDKRVKNLSNIITDIIDNEIEQGNVEYNIYDWESGDKFKSTYISRVVSAFNRDHSSIGKAKNKDDSICIEMINEHGVPIEIIIKCI